MEPQVSVQSAQAEPQNSTIGTILLILGIAVLIIGFIGGFVVGAINGEGMIWSLAVVVWLYAGIVGVFLIAFGEVIRLLSHILFRLER